MTRKSHGALLNFRDAFSPKRTCRRPQENCCARHTKLFLTIAEGWPQPTAWRESVPPTHRCTIRISHSQEKTAVRLRVSFSRSLGFEVQRFRSSLIPYFGSAAGPRLPSLGRGRGDLS